MSQETLKKNRIKQALFLRDGWYDKRERKHKAHCAFGCGDELTFDTATIDHYPIMACDGGPLSVDNGRLACVQCNSMNERKPKDGLIPRPPDAGRKWRQWKAKETQEFPELFLRFPQYSEEIRQKLRQNYPPARGRDKNGILLENI